MPRREVVFVPGEFYHVYNRGNDRQRIFFDRDNYVHLLTRMRMHVVEHATVVTYCLMPNHYHLLVQLLTDRFSSAMHACGMSYAKSVNKRRGRVGSLFQGRFRAIHVDQREYLLHLSRYIHVNPVTAGIVRRPEDWEFSSYREYVGLRDGSLPSPQIVLKEFDSRGDYARFVNARVDLPSECTKYLFDEE